MKLLPRLILLMAIILLPQPIKLPPPLTAWILNGLRNIIFHFSVSTHGLMGLPGLNGHKKARYYLKTALLKSFGFEPSLKRFYFLENFADHLRFKQCWNVGEVNNAPVISSMWKPEANPATRNWQILQNARFLQVLIFSKYYNFPDFLFEMCFVPFFPILQILNIQAKPYF